MKKKVATLAVAAVASLGVAALMPGSASAYTTSRNWYSMTWYLNKSETWQVRNEDAIDFGGVLGWSWPMKVALTAYWGSFQWIAYQARLRNGCEKIVWIYVNLPYPEMYWGPSCY